MGLTDTAVRNAKPGFKPLKDGKGSPLKGPDGKPITEPTDKPYTLADEKGLYLQVTPSGGKLWRMKYRFSGKEKLLAFGKYPEVSLAEARDRRDEARKLLAAGTDPGEHRQAVKLAKAAEGCNTFEAVARQWHAKVKASLVPEYAQKILRSLEMDVFPAIGKRPIAEIRPPEMLAMLRKIEARGTLETLKRVRQRCADVFTFAIASGLRETENPVAGLEKTLQTAKVRHHPALHARHLPDFFTRLEIVRISQPVKQAIQLAILLFLRPGELRSARWPEIDLDSATWIVPGERDRERGMTGMKMKEAHVVPLSRQAVEIFRQLQPYSGSGELVFPNRNDPTRPMSNGTVNSALRAMGYAGDEVTGHGFRATAASALAEMGFRKEVIDRQLAHKERNQVLSAYIHQAEYLEERRVLMQTWADYIDSLTNGGKVIPIQRREGAAPQ